MLKYEGFRNFLTTIHAFVTNAQSHSTICPSNSMLISSFSLDLVQYANIGTSINNSLAISISFLSPHQSQGTLVYSIALN